MATKRQIVAQLTTDDLKLLAEAAEKGDTIKTLNSRDQKRVRRAVKLIRTIPGAQ